ncbi:MAG: STN domain-containing protein [Phaeodactylibacter sp.]|nr:STN domain-containing protein [Phaeodactylibacter sp.]MCB9294551.1 STN domain-containing protein [Lewinellaceae bacterium]
MKNARLLFGFLFFLGFARLQGQALEQRVTLEYAGEPLGEVLADISERYPAVRFSYSPNFIPVSRRVTLRVADEPLATALDEIARQAPVAYAAVGGQVLLKPDNSRNEQLGQLQTLKGNVRQTSPIYPSDPRVDQQTRAERERLMRRMYPIGEPERARVIKSGGDSYREVNLSAFYKPLPEITEEKATAANNKGDTRLAQISLLPFVGTNALRSNEITNRFSVNLLWGTNGGVDGMEVGGFVNNVKRDVRGVQVAGFGSTVGQSVTGTQVSGLFNIIGDTLTGVQASGLINIAGHARAVQAAGLSNITNGDFAGVQAAGLFNISAGNADGIQAAGLFNVSAGKVKTQASSLFNIAGDVQVGQASALLNVGKKVGGFQIGLINVADTVSGVPAGLLNIIKHGYNRFELSVNDALYANASLKLGAYRFYNIIHLGARWDDVAPGTAETTMSWGLGYGLGTALRLNPRLLLNIEGVAIHINEQERWTNELNLLNQLRFTLDFHQESRRTSIFAGPVANVLVSKLYDPDTGTLGSAVIAPSYTLLNHAKGGTSVKLWAGLQAGVRF